MKGNCGECERRWACEIDPNECNEWTDPAPMTNAQKIRSMSDEALAEFLIDLADDGNLKIRDWLQQPAEEDKHENLD